MKESKISITMVNFQKQARINKIDQVHECRNLIQLEEVVRKILSE